MINKLCNNLHAYDAATHAITNPSHPTHGTQDIDAVRVCVENIMEVVHRVYMGGHWQSHLHRTSANTREANSAMMRDHKSVTYNTIHYLLDKYATIKDMAMRDTTSKTIREAKNCNDNVMLMAQIEHIRHAAHSIISSQKDQGRAPIMEGDMDNHIDRDHMVDLNAKELSISHMSTSKK